MTPADRARRLRLMVFDVDGILTDGRLYYGPRGEAMKAFDVKDGHGLKMLAAAGVAVALLTARKSDIVAVRARELGIADVLQGQTDKAAAFDRLAASHHLQPEHCGYAGDDLPDLPVLERAGFAATVADAVEAVRQAAHYVASRPGGRGGARAICDFVLTAQGAPVADPRRGAKVGTDA